MPADERAKQIYGVGRGNLVRQRVSELGSPRALTRRSDVDSAISGAMSSRSAASGDRLNRPQLLRRDFDEVVAERLQPSAASSRMIWLASCACLAIRSSCGMPFRARATTSSMGPRAFHGLPPGPDPG